MPRRQLPHVLNPRRLPAPAARDPMSVAHEKKLVIFTYRHAQDLDILLGSHFGDWSQNNLREKEKVSGDSKRGGEEREPKKEKEERKGREKKRRGEERRREEEKEKEGERRRKKGRGGKGKKREGKRGKENGKGKKSDRRKGEKKSSAAKFIMGHRFGSCKGQNRALFGLVSTVSPSMDPVFLRLVFEGRS